MKTLPLAPTNHLAWAHWSMLPQQWEGWRKGWVQHWPRTPTELSSAWGLWGIGIASGSQVPRNLPRAIPPLTQHILSQNNGFLLVGQVCGSENIKPLPVFQHLIATFIPSFTLWAQKWVLGGLQDVLSHSCPHSTQKVGWTRQGRILNTTPVFKAAVLTA